MVGAHKDWVTCTNKQIEAERVDETCRCKGRVRITFAVAGGKCGVAVSLMREAVGGRSLVD